MTLRIATLTLAKFMTVSERFCEENLGVLLALMKSSEDACTRGNLAIAVGDLAVSFSNLLDQNLMHLYDCLHDTILLSRKTRSWS